MIKYLFYANHLHTYNAPRSTILPDTGPSDNAKNTLILPIQLYHSRGKKDWHPRNATRAELTDAIADGLLLVR